MCLFAREVEGFTIRACIEYDDDAEPPWERAEGHGPVSEWTSRRKAPGERVLSTDGSHHRFYNFMGAVQIAKRDGWNAPPYDEGTKAQRAARAVERDFEFLRSWCDDEWHYVGVILSVAKNGVVLDKHAASVWGIEDNATDYLIETAEEMIPEAVEVGRAVLAKLDE